MATTMVEAIFQLTKKLTKKPILTDYQKVLSYM